MSTEISSVLMLMLLCTALLPGCSREEKPMIEACRQGDLEKVRTLLNQGADVNMGSRDKRRYTPLMMASAFGHNDIVKLLLEHGADPLARTKGWGLAALDFALKEGNPDTVLLLLKECPEYNDEKIKAYVLTHNAAAGHTNVITFLLKQGVDINTRDHRGATALMEASGATNLPLVKFLFAKGSDVSLSADDGSTALMEASALGTKELVKVLLDAGAEVNATDREGKTALMIASSYGNLDVVKLLLDHDANKNATDEEGRTALDLAKKRWDNKEVIALLEK